MRVETGFRRRTSTDRWTGEQTDRQRDRQTDRQGVYVVELEQRTDAVGKKVESGGFWEGVQGLKGQVTGNKSKIKRKRR